MSETNAAATLSIAITTGDAAAQLETLATKYEALKQSFAKGAGASGFSKEATKEMTDLKVAMVLLEQKNRDLLSQVQTLTDGFKNYSATVNASAASISSSISGVSTKARVSLSEMDAAFQESSRKQIAAAKAMANTGLDYSTVRKGAALLKLETDGTVKSLNALIATLGKAKAVKDAFTAKNIDASSFLEKDFGAGVDKMLMRLPELQARLAGLQGSVTSTGAAQRGAASATKDATNAQQKWNAMAGEGHALARGLSGSLGTLWMTYGQLAPLMAGAALGAGFKAAAQAGAELAYQLTFVKALGDESAGAVAVLTARTLELSKSSLYGPTEIASGFRVLAQAGLNANDALKAMPQTLDLATVGEMEMEQAATTLVGVMNAFGLSVERASHVGDVFAKAAALSQTSVQAMTNAMKTASVVGEQYGASMEDTATAITLLAKVNITGTAAGTSLRNMLKELYTPTAGAASVMKNLGLVTKDASGQMRPFADIVYDLQGKLKDFNKADQTTILQKIFGERGAKEAISMLALTRAEWDDLNKSISDSSGFMRKVGEELEGTVKGRWTQAINTLKSNLTSAFGDMEGTFGAIADNLKSMFNDPAFIASLKTLVTGMSTLVATLAQAGPVLVRFAEAWVAVKVGMVAASMWTATAAGITGVSGALRTAQAATTAYSVGLGVAVGAANTAAASTSVLSTAVGTLPARFALLANPITATVAVLATLGTAFYLFRDRTAESMEQSAKHIADFSKDAIKSLEEVLAKVDQSNVHVQSAVVKANEAVIGNNLKTMTSQLDVLKRQFGFADAKSATDYVAQVDRDYAGNTLAHDDARRDRKSDKYKAAKAYNDILQETIKLQGVYGEAVQKTEELETKRWAAKVESAIIDQNRAEKDLSGVLGGDSKTPNGASDVVAQINKDYEGRIKAIQDGAKAEETALRKAYQQSEISEVELIEGVAAAKAQAHVEALESYNEQIAKAEKAGAKGSQLTDLKNKQAEEVRAITQVWDDATADVAEVKRKFAETLLSWEAKAFAKDNTTAVDEAQAQITQMMAALTKEMKEFPEADALRIANAIKAIYNAALIKDAKAEIQKNFNAISTGLTDLGSEVDALESDMGRDGGWVSRVMNTQQINDLIATKLPELRAQLEEVNRLLAAAPEGTDENGQLTKLRGKITRDIDKLAHYVSKVWKDTVKEIDATFHDGFVAMMKDGKTSWKEFTKSLKGMFKTTVADAIYQMLARPLVMDVMVKVAGAFGMQGLSGAASAADGSSGGGSSSWLSLGNNAYQAYTGESTLGTMFSDFAMSGAGSALGLSATTGLSSALGVAGGAGTTMGASAALAAAEASAAGATATTLTAAGSALSSAMTVIPYIGLAAGAVSMLSSAFSKGGTPHVGGIVFSDGETISNPRSLAAIQAEYATPEQQLGTGFARSDWTKRYSQTVADALEPSASAMATMLNTAAESFGQATGYKVGMALSFDGEDKARSGFDILDGSGNSVYDWGNRKFSSDSTKGTTQYLAATADAARDVLMTITPDWADAILTDLGDDIDLDGLNAAVTQINAIAEAAERMAPALGMTADNFAEIYLKAGDAAMSAYYSLVTSSSEQLSDSYRVVSDAFDNLGVAIPDSIDGFRDLITSLDETSEEGQETIASLFQLASAFGTVQQAIDNLKSGVASAVFDLRSEEEQQAILTQQLADAANEAGVAIPATAAELVALADSIDYTTQAGMQLATAMPTLAAAFVAAQSSLLAQSESAKLETQASRIDEYLQAQQAAQAELISQQQDAYSEAVSAAQDMADTFQSIVESLEDFRQSLLQSDASTLTPEQQYAEAKKVFELTAAKAKLGDADAANNLQSVVNDFLSASKKISATSADYALDFGKSIAALDGVIGTASNQANIANQQLAVAQAQLDALNAIAASIGSSGSTATDSLPVVVEDFTQAMLDWEAWFARTTIGQTENYDVGSTTRISNDKGIFTDLTGNSYMFSQSDGPYALADQSAAWAEEMLKRYGQWKVPSYDVGTNFVPKDMLAMVHQGEAIVPRQFNPALHNTSSDNAELIAEVQALRSELKIALSTVANNTAKTAKTLDRVMPEGDALAVRIAA